MKLKKWITHDYEYWQPLYHLCILSRISEIRKSNIRAAKALADAIRTSLGPKGMDKMIKDAKSNVTITNDGATILKQVKCDS